MPDPNLALFQLALKNSKQFIQDAQILLDSGSIGHAYGLTVLAFEEFGKAIMGFSAFLGVIERDSEEFKILFRNHSDKQWMGLTYIQALLVLEFLDTLENKKELNKLMTDFIKGIISPERYTREFLKLLDSENSPIARQMLSLVEIELKFIQDKKWMDKRKQRSFYVDFSKNDSRVLLSPQDEYEFDKSSVQEVINSHKWWIEYFLEIEEKIRKMKKLPRELIQVKKMIKKLMNLLKENNDDENP